LITASKLASENAGEGAALVSMEGGPSVEVAVLDRVIRVTSIAAMEAYSAPVGYVFSLNAGGRSGVFDVIAGDFSTELAADTLNGIYIGLSDDPTANTKVLKRRLNHGFVSPKMFGAEFDLTTIDTPAIQAAIRAGLPVRCSGGAGALIDSSIVPVSGTSIDADFDFIFKLADNSNCEMIKAVDTATKNYIIISGGIWDMNGANQVRNDGAGYIGTCIQLADINNLIIRNLTLKDPLSYGLQIGDISNFTINNIKLDYDNLRSNMDGVHVHGGCFDGLISNIRGVTNDDMVALNANDGDKYELRAGPIARVKVENIQCEGEGYRGVRLLSGGDYVDEITIDGIHGRYQYAAVALTKYTFATADTDFRRITIKDITASSNGSIEATILVEAANVLSLDISGIKRIASEAGEKEILDVKSGANISDLVLNNTLLTTTVNLPSFITLSGYVREFNIIGAQIKIDQAVITSGSFPFLKVNSTGDFGQIIVQHLQTSALKNILLMSSGSTGDILQMSNCNTSNIVGPAFKLDNASINRLLVSNGQIGNGDISTLSSMLSVESSSSVGQCIFSMIKFSRWQDGFGTYNNSGIIKRLTVIGCDTQDGVAFNRDFIRLDGDVTELIEIVVAGCKIRQNGFPLYRKGNQLLRVNSSQLPIDRTLISAPEDGDQVLNSSTAGAALGLYTYLNGAWR